MNRKLLVRGIALLLFVMVAVSAFAAFGWKDGVRYEDVELSGERYLQLYNGNDYTVRVYLDNAIGRGYGHTWVDLKPEELYNAFKTNGANGIIKSVVKM